MGKPFLIVYSHARPKQYDSFPDQSPRTRRLSVNEGLSHLMLDFQGLLKYKWYTD